MKNQLCHHRNKFINPKLLNGSGSNHAVSCGRLKLGLRSNFRFQISVTSDLEENMSCVLEWTVVLDNYFNRGDVEMLKEAQARGVCHGGLHQLCL